jgi:beta-galactosidase
MFMRKFGLSVPLVTVMLTLLALSPAVAGELSIPDEPLYVDVQWPECRQPAGFYWKPIPQDWKALSLEGAWAFKTMPFVKNNANPLDDEGMAAGYFKPEFDDAAWQKLRTSSSWYWEPGPQYEYIEGKLGWYRQSFELSAEMLAEGRRIALDFRRVNWQADVWVNGQVAGMRHDTRFDSFQYDVTALVKPGLNHVAVRVYDYVGHKQYWRRWIGGIDQPVRVLSIPAQVYAHRMMITCHVDKGMVEAEADFTNPGQRPVTLELQAEIASVTGGATQSVKLRPITVKPGTNKIELGEFALQNPVPWSPENPHLYWLRVVDAQGRSVALQRFGFREFKAEGEWLMLNGRKFKPRGHTFDTWTRRSLHLNENQEMEQLLRYLKSQNINMLRPHSMNGVLPETFFHLCDEIGLVVYLDWPGGEYGRTYGQKYCDGLLSMWPSQEKCFLDLYSHASLCMWSFGNEHYEGHDGNAYNEVHDILYGRMRKLDRQNRPLCTSTGRQTLEAMASGSLRERTDVLDDHQYRGGSCGTWQDNFNHIDRYAELAQEFFGKPMPKIDCEYGVPGDNLRYRPVTFEKLWPAFQLDPATLEFKRQLVEMLSSDVPEVGGYIRLKLNYCSPRIYVTEEAECRRLYAEKFFKRVAEVYRRAETKCLGGHTNTGWSDMVRPTLRDGGTASFYGKPGPMDASKDRWCYLPLHYSFKRAMNPTLVSAGVFNQHPCAGSEQTIEVFVTNDLNAEHDFSVRAQLRLSSKTCLSLPTLKFDNIGEMSQKSLLLKFAIPKLNEAARGQLELFLFMDGVRVGDNRYPVTVLPDEPINLPGIETAALYDVSEELFRGLTQETTSQVLASLGVKVKRISDFSSLDKYRVLIIGANSFDSKLIDAGEVVHTWIQKGGKVLCFEQSLCGRMPFYPNYSVIAGRPSTYVSMSVPTHPLFAGLVPEDFDSWSGFKGCAFDYALGPLSEGLVAVSPIGSSGDNGNAGSIVADVKFGEGQIVFSQLMVTKRYAQDSVARAYLGNLLRYMFQDGMPRFAVTLPEQAFAKSLFVADKDALFLDLKPFVNRSFDDDVGGDGKGGWADFGGGGFKEIPAGQSRLQGGVPFSIIDPATNDNRSCIVLKGQMRPNFPESVTGIPVKAKVNAFYFLQTAMYAKAGTSVTYVFHYENGQTRSFKASNERDLPDWWLPAAGGNRPNAIVVFAKDNRALFLCEVLNPLPTETVTSLDIVSAGQSIPIIVAITARKRFNSVVAGVGEQ